MTEETFTTTMVYDCLIDLGIDIKFRTSHKLCVKGTDVEFWVFPRYVIVYTDAKSYDGQKIRDIFDLQDWAINYFK